MMEIEPYFVAARMGRKEEKREGGDPRRQVPVTANQINKIIN